MTNQKVPRCAGGAWEVCGRCVRDAQEVRGIHVGGGGDKCIKVKCMGGAWEVVGIST